MKRSLWRRLVGARANGNGVAARDQLAQFLTAPAGEPAPDGAESGVDGAIAGALGRLLALRQPDGHWVAPMDSNAAINAEFIMFMHFIGRIDAERQRRLALGVERTQSADGSWPTYHGGPGNLSTTVLCYYGLKLAGHDPEAPLLTRARDWILAHGGVTRSKFECKFLLCLFGQYPWRGLPHMPIGILLAPTAFTFSIYNLSYWARCCLVPMMVLSNAKARVDPPVGCEELFVEPRGRRWLSPSRDVKLVSLQHLFIRMAGACKLFELGSGRMVNRLGRQRAHAWILKHQDDAGDWGGIYPSMMYSLMALHVLGTAWDDPRFVRGMQALIRFSVDEPDGSQLMQACVSPIWDTAWVANGLAELPEGTADAPLAEARTFLWSHQIFREGDWAVKHPDGVPGGWCFQYHNDYYPDLDDTAVVLMALAGGIEGDATRQACFRVGVEWLLGMQNDDGGWAAFDRNLDKEIINHLPFNDIQNMLDPSTADLTGRILELLGNLGMTTAHEPVARGLAWLRQAQEPSGAWYGRWGVNYIYGTWSVLMGLAAIGEDMRSPYIRKAVAWLVGSQNADGGWGERCDSYDDPARAGRGPSTASQTAWALLALIAAGDADARATAAGVAYLQRTQAADGGWDEQAFTGTGFPGAFYLRYRMYSLYFPFLALTRYRNAMAGHAVATVEAVTAG